MKVQRLLFSGLVLTYAVAARADSRYAGSAMELGAGARGLGLGGHTAALYGRAEDFYANPAAIGMLRFPCVGLMYAPTFGSLSDPMAMYHYVGGAVPLYAGGTVGLHWTRYSVDEIPLYPKLAGNSLADRLANYSLRPSGAAVARFEDVEDVFYISFARSFRPLIPMSWLYGDLPVTIPIGLNIKILRQRLYHETASALGLDLGAMILFSLERLLDMEFLGEVNVAFSALDLTQTPVVWSNRHEDRIRRTLLAGFSYQEDFGSSVAVCIYYTRYQKYQIAHLYGVEARYRGLALRCGRGEQGPHFGAGLAWRKLIVDYAFTTYDFGVAHRLSCSFVFVRERRAVPEQR